MSQRLMERLARLAFGLPTLLHYRFAADVRYDRVAGIAVAAVALPVAVAYAEPAGFDPVIGLYSSILPLVAYVLFGISRQLMVNPDAATCAMIAAAITPPLWAMPNCMGRSHHLFQRLLLQTAGIGRG